MLLGLCHSAPGCKNAIEAQQQEIIYYWTVTELKEMMETKQQEIIKWWRPDEPWRPSVRFRVGPSKTSTPLKGLDFGHETCVDVGA